MVEASDQFGQNPADQTGFDNFISNTSMFSLCISTLHALQAAYNQRINPNPEHHYPGYVWITLGWYRDDWWRERVAGDNQIRCSDIDLEPFMRNTFSLQLGNSTLDTSAETNVGLVSLALSW